MPAPTSPVQVSSQAPSSVVGGLVEEKMQSPKLKSQQLKQEIFKDTTFEPTAKLVKKASEAELGVEPLSDDENNDEDYDSQPEFEDDEDPDMGFSVHQQKKASVKKQQQHHRDLARMMKVDESRHASDVVSPFVKQRQLQENKAAKTNESQTINNNDLNKTSDELSSPNSRRRRAQGADRTHHHHETVVKPKQSEEYDFHLQHSSKNGHKYSLGGAKKQAVRLNGMTVEEAAAAKAKRAELRDAFDLPSKVMQIGANSLP